MNSVNQRKEDSTVKVHSIKKDNFGMKMYKIIFGMVYLKYSFFTYIIIILLII